jgi:hypothetical protein
MSGGGYISVKQMERMREEARRSQVREECQALLERTAALLEQGKQNLSTSGFVSESSELDKLVGEAYSQMSLSPDQALQSARLAIAQVSAIQTEARAKKQMWGEERRKVDELLSRTINQLKSISIKNKEGQKAHQSNIARLEKMTDVPLSLVTLESMVEETLNGARESQARDLQEEVRKELVRRLLGGLRASNYVISGPVLKDGRVEILATTPAGKKVRFEINDQCRIGFDLDGFIGETCKDAVDAVLERLRSDGTDGEIEQFNWHNPYKIKKGAKDLPHGAAQVREARR